MTTSSDHFAGAVPTDLIERFKRTDDNVDHAGLGRRGTGGDAYLTAIGLTGPPSPPSNGSGLALSRNS